VTCNRRPAFATLSYVSEWWPPLNLTSDIRHPHPCADPSPDPDPEGPRHAAQDLEKGETRAFKQARAFYEGLADRLVASGHALDVFACSLDQVGLDEMRPAVASTGLGFCL